MVNREAGAFGPPHVPSLNIFQQASMEDWSRDTLRKAIQKDFFTLKKTKALKPGQATLEHGRWRHSRRPNRSGFFGFGSTSGSGFEGSTRLQLIRNGVKTGKAPDRADQAKAFVEDRLKGIEFVVIKANNQVLKII